MKKYQFAIKQTKLAEVYVVYASIFQPVTLNTKTHNMKSFVFVLLAAREG